jgi:hypothetical protein
MRLAPTLVAASIGLTLALLASARGASAQSSVDIPIGCGPKSLTPAVDPSLMPFDFAPGGVMRPFWLTLLRNTGGMVPGTPSRTSRIDRAPRIAGPGPAVSPARRSTR